MSPTVTDDQLSTYLDGASDRALSDMIDRALAEDEALRARVERMRHNDRTFRDAVDARLGPVPDRLLEIASGRIAVAVAREKPRTRRLVEYGVIAATVVVAFLAGGGVDRYLSASQPAEVALGRQGLVASHDLAAALSTAPSGVPTRVVGGAMSVQLSFLASDGRHCRRFRLAHQGSGESGVACHQENLWHVEVLVSGRSEAERTGFATASGPNAVVDSVIDGLGVRKSLDRHDEAAAIRSGWVNNP